MSIKNKMLECTRCHEIKPIEEFHNSKYTPNRFYKTHTCKDCNRRRDSTPEAKQQRQKSYSSEKEKRKRRQKEYEKKVSFKPGGYFTYFVVVSFKSEDKLFVGESIDYKSLKRLDHIYLDDYTLLGAYVGKLRVEVFKEFGDYLYENNRSWLKYDDDIKHNLEIFLSKYEKTIINDWVPV